MFGAARKPNRPTIRRNPCPGAAPSAETRWPGLSGPTQAELVNLISGRPLNNPNAFAIKHERFYHVLDYATTGHQQLTFFNATPQLHVTNLDAGKTPADRPCVITGLCVTWQDLSAAGASLGGFYNAAAIDTPAKRADEVRRLLQAGLLILKVQDREMLHVQDLTHFPSDGGFYASVANSVGTTGVGTIGFAAYNNGEPIAGNRFMFTEPVVLLPQKQVSVTLNWATAQTVTVAGRVKVELVGESIVALNA